MSPVLTLDFQRSNARDAPDDMHGRAWDWIAENIIRHEAIMLN
jgi:hypothetical protein